MKPVLDRAFMVLYPVLTAVLLFTFASQFEDFQSPISGDAVNVLFLFVLFAIFAIGFAMVRYTTPFGISTITANVCALYLAASNYLLALAMFFIAMIAIGFNFYRFAVRQELEKSIEDYRAKASPHIGM